jgi:ABC-type lipoprotein release transport system permease subunit
VLSAAEPLFQPGVFVAVLLLAPTLAVLASWMPAMLAASQDPAAVLREE